jgi:hypothetical protein
MNPVKLFLGAIHSRKEFHFGSTEVKTHNQEKTEVFLYGRKIATFEWRANRLRISHAGIKTTTTQQRLNMLLKEFTHSKITAKNKLWLLDGEEFNYADLPISKT